MIHKKDLFFLVVISAIFLFLTIYNIYYVGFSSDEVSPGLWGVYFLKGKVINFRSDININILGKEFPVNLIQTYVFALEKETTTYFIARHTSRHFDLLRHYMGKLNRHIVPEASFYNKINEPLFHLYRVER